MLGDRNVHVDYIMTDGASINRKRARMLFPHSETPRTSAFVFCDTLFPQHKMVNIQDMMHCLKNIRYNIELSKLQHKTKSKDVCSQKTTALSGKHWSESFNYNRFSIHRKSTEEHINLAPSSKMKNEMAIQVLKVYNRISTATLLRALANELTLQLSRQSVGFKLKSPWFAPSCCHSSSSITVT